jgi:hypothetical protein
MKIKRKPSYSPPKPISYIIGTLEAMFLDIAEKTKQDPEGFTLGIREVVDYFLTNKIPKNKDLYKGYVLPEITEDNIKDVLRFEYYHQSHGGYGDDPSGEITVSIMLEPSRKTIADYELKYQNKLNEYNKWMDDNGDFVKQLKQLEDEKKAAKKLLEEKTTKIEQLYKKVK